MLAAATHAAVLVCERLPLCLTLPCWYVSACRCDSRCRVGVCAATHAVVLVCERLPLPTAAAVSVWGAVMVRIADESVVCSFREPCHVPNTASSGGRNRARAVQRGIAVEWVWVW